MAIVTLDEMRSYLRLDDNTEEDILIESLLLTAEEYLKSATGFTFALKVPETAKLIVKLLVSHWYENRGIVTYSPTNKISFTVDTLLAQLRYSHHEDDLIIVVVDEGELYE